MAQMFLVRILSIVMLLLAAVPAQAQFLGVGIKAELAKAIAGTKSESLRKRLMSIDEHYAKTAYKPVWIEGNRPTRNAEIMVDALNLSYEDGLHPEDYDAMALFQKLGTTDASGLADLEVHLSTAAVSYAQHMHSGRLDPRAVNREILIYPSAISADTVLSNLRKTRSIKAYVRLLAPHTPRYERLRQALAFYRRIEANGGFSKIADGPVLKPGAVDARIPAIRKRMLEAGTLSAQGSGNSYDQNLAKAVIRFQENMGLESVGTIGKQTISAMNVPVADRIRTMELNLERNRWMQNDFGRYHIFANLADQVVKVVRDDKTVHAEVIQVGQPYHRTPVFSDVMEYVELNPYWGVPPSIAVNEYLPKLRKNPNVLASQNISVFSGGGKISASAVNWSSYGKGNFPFTLRQEPGPGNALGRVKFMFPNDFNVYMHDTPAKSKFDASQRYFSHGCLRLKDPLKMAEILLGPEGWSRGKIDAVVGTGKNTVVKLKSQIPVHIVYLTAFVNKDGSVNFREDVYGRDKILSEALAKVRGR
ncbi:MAG: L,D-transpeptidase family protein [Rhizobiaceae bacterium]